MSDWKPIRGNRLMREDPRGFIVIKPADGSPTIPLVCPHCGIEMRVASDRDHYRQNGCCTDCSVMWASGPNAQRWREGWRPDRDVVEERAAIRRASPFTPSL